MLHIDCRFLNPLFYDKSKITTPPQGIAILFG
jgi:hypothetical protein